jgi:hypothetical protein
MSWFNNIWVFINDQILSYMYVFLTRIKYQIFWQTTFYFSLIVPVFTSLFFFAISVISTHTHRLPLFSISKSATNQLACLDRRHCLIDRSSEKLTLNFFFDIFLKYSNSSSSLINTTHVNDSFSYQTKII